MLGRVPAQVFRSVGLSLLRRGSAGSLRCSNKHQLSTSCFNSSSSFVPCLNTLIPQFRSYSTTNDELEDITKARSLIANNEPLKALQHLKSSFDIYRSTVGPTDPKTVGVIQLIFRAIESLFSTSSTLILHESVFLSLPLLEQMVEYAIENNNWGNAAQVSILILRALINSENTQQIVEKVNKLEAILIQHTTEIPQELVVNGFIQIAEILGWFDTQRDSIDSTRALNICAQLLPQLESTTELIPEKILVYRAQGIALAFQKKFGEAEQSLKKALKLAESLENGSGYIGFVLHALAKYYQRQGLSTYAGALYTTAENMLFEGGHQNLVALVQKDHADFDETQKK